MRIALIADTFPPLRTSGAVQIRDLAAEFARQGHRISVLLPDPGISTPALIEARGDVEVVRLRTPKTKDIAYFRRAMAELLMPFLMLRNLRKSGLRDEQWDGVVWYSPSIFHGPLAKALMRQSGSKGYLIIRDIFPEWAAEVGVMRRGLAYRILQMIARYQYSVASIIGVQSEGNRHYFKQWEASSGRRLEVLQNWLADAPEVECALQVSRTPLAGRKIFVYAGNMGVAQGLDIILEVAESLSQRRDIGFLFVGRGSEASRFSALAKERQLDNVSFHEEIDPDQIPALYKQCRAGIVALDPRLTSHNIPGKFLTYMQSGLPVLANINAGNDLANIIRSENVGHVCETNQRAELCEKALRLVDQISEDKGLPARCLALFQKRYAVSAAVKQIVVALSQ